MMPIMQPSILFALSASAAQFAHMELVVHQDPQDPFHWAAPQVGRSQLVLHLWIMFYQVEDLMLVLVGLHTVLVRPIFQSLLIFLQGDSPFWSVHFPTQFGKLANSVSVHLIPSCRPLIKVLNRTRRSIDPWGTNLWQVARLKRTYLPLSSGYSLADRSPPTAQTTCLEPHISVATGGDCGKQRQKRWRNPGRKCPPLAPHQPSWLLCPRRRPG